MKYYFSNKKGMIMIQYIQNGGTLKNVILNKRNQDIRTHTAELGGGVYVRGMDLGNIHQCQ